MTGSDMKGFAIGFDLIDKLDKKKSNEVVTDSLVLDILLNVKSLKICDSNDSNSRRNDKDSSNKRSYRKVSVTFGVRD